MNNTMVGVDLAKEVIQVCIYTNQRVHSNKEMTHNEFLLWLFKKKPSIIIFETCSTSNYWKQKAIEAGREAYLAGRMPRKRYASASSPIDGTFF